MKIKYNIILSVLFGAISLLFTSCYKDIGNYDYDKLPTIVVDAQDIVHATQFETIKVPVSVDLDGYPEKDFAFSWRIWSDAIGGDTMKKVISTSKDLEYEVNDAPGKYSLVLTVKNKKTNVDNYKELKLMVQGVISAGWMVLHEKDGKTDFDLIMSPFFSPSYSKDIVLNNLYEAVNGEQLEGRGVKISSYFALGRYQYVVILTENGGVRLNAISMQKVYDLPTLMLDKKPLKPENYHYFSYYWCLGRGSEVIISDGRFYINKLLGNGFTEPVFRDGGNYKASPWTPKWMWTFESIIYDELGGRFLAVESEKLAINSLPSANGRLFDWNNMHSTLRYMETGFRNYEYALMKDWTSNEHKLYVFDFDVKTNFDIAMYSANACPDLDNAKHFALGQRGNVFYYATANDIYQYDYAGTNTGDKVYSVGPDETITGMKIFKSTVDRYITSHPYDNKVLILSTYNESTKEGKIYMYYINESNGRIDKSSQKVLGGFGKILDMEYNFPKYG